MMRILLVVFTVFLLSFPAGLFMYWITSNLVTLIQNYLIYNHGPGKKVLVAPDKEKASAEGQSRSEDGRQNSASDGGVSRGTPGKQTSTSGRKRKRRR